MLNKISITDVFIGIFPKNIQKNCIKRKPSEGSSILNASNERTLTKKLVPVNSPQSWPWKQNGTSYGCYDDSRSCDQLKNGVTDKYIKKRLDFEPVSFPFRKCSYNCNTWVTGVYMAYMFEWNSGGKTSLIEWLLESNLRSFGYFKCSTAL